VNAPHQQIADAITEAAGRTAAAAMKIARLTGGTQKGTLDAIHDEASRMLNSIRECRKLRTAPGENGGPQAKNPKCAPTPINQGKTP